MRTRSALWLLMKNTFVYSIKTKSGIFVLRNSHMFTEPLCLNYNPRTISYLIPPSKWKKRNLRTISIWRKSMEISIVESRLSSTVRSLPMSCMQEISCALWLLMEKPFSYIVLRLNQVYLSTLNVHQLKKLPSVAPRNHSRTETTKLDLPI